MLDTAYSFDLIRLEDDQGAIAALELRPAAAEDAGFAYDVKKRALGPYIEQVWGWREAEQLSYHRREYKAELISIITLAGTDIGTVSVTSDGSRVLLCMLYILPEDQRQGIGTHIVRSVQAQAQRDHLPVLLGVLKVNPAKQLYRRLGFVEVEETETHVKMQWNPATMSAAL